MDRPIHKIEITEAMLEAGGRVLVEHGGADYNPHIATPDYYSEIVREILEAALQAAPILPENPIAH